MKQKRSVFACCSLSRSTELHKDMVASWLPWILFLWQESHCLYPPIWGTHTGWHKTCLSPHWFLRSCLAQAGTVKRFRSIHPSFSKSCALQSTCTNFYAFFLGGTLWDGLRKCLCGCEGHGVDTGFCIWKSNEFENVFLQLQTPFLWQVQQLFSVTSCKIAVFTMCWSTATRAASIKDRPGLSLTSFHSSLENGFWNRLECTPVRRSDCQRAWWPRQTLAWGLKGPKDDLPSWHLLCFNTGRAFGMWQATIVLRKPVPCHWCGHAPGSSFECSRKTNVGRKKFLILAA